MNVKINLAIEYSQINFYIQRIMKRQTKMRNIVKKEVMSYKSNKNLL